MPDSHSDGAAGSSWVESWGCVLVGGAAYAAIPDSNGVITAVTRRTSGNLQVIDPSAGDTCRPSEIPDQLEPDRPGGAAGAAGPKGDTGATGPRGRQAPKGDTGAARDRWAGWAEGRYRRHRPGRPHRAGRANRPAGPNNAAGTSCPTGTQVIGFNPNGTIICNTAAPPACASHTFHFTMTSSTGGLFTDATWPGATETQNGPEGSSCSVTVKQPSGDIVLVGTLGDAWTIVSKTGYGTAVGTAFAPSSCPPLGIPNVTAGRPYSSTGLNGSATATFQVAAG